MSVVGCFWSLFTCLYALHCFLKYTPYIAFLSIRPTFWIKMANLFLPSPKSKLSLLSTSQSHIFAKSISLTTVRISWILFCIINILIFNWVKSLQTRSFFWSEYGKIQIWTLITQCLTSYRHIKINHISMLSTYH